MLGVNPNRLDFSESWTSTLSCFRTAIFLHPCATSTCRSLNDSTMKVYELNETQRLGVAWSWSSGSGSSAWLTWGMHIGLLRPTLREASGNQTHSAMEVCTKHDIFVNPLSFMFQDYTAALCCAWYVFHCFSTFPCSHCLSCIFLALKVSCKSQRQALNSSPRAAAQASAPFTVLRSF